jgi:FkbH-like protein
MGVLVGVASKNDPEVAMAAVRREDLIVPMSALFPIEVSWGAKSAAVSRILKTWNIAADSVVFVDDSQMELAEVERAHPGIECLRFEAERPDTVYQLLWRLRELFGKPAIGEEDRIRSQSLRRAQPPKEGANQEAVSSEFLHTIGAEIALDFRKDPNDSRAYELLNKTNQFNLNGRRLTEQEWRLIGEDPRSFVVTVSYQDKFGPLGKIAVLTGRKEPERLIVSSWVMSCRAFSRRIEHHTLERLIAYFKPAMLELDFVPTERNGPLQEFLSSIGCPLSSPVKLDPATFSKNRGPLPHEVTETYA